MEWTEPGILDLWRCRWSATPIVNTKQWVPKNLMHLTPATSLVWWQGPLGGTLQCLGYYGIALQQWFNKSPQSHQPMYYNRIYTFFWDMIPPIHHLLLVWKESKIFPKKTHLIIKLCCLQIVGFVWKSGTPKSHAQSSHVFSWDCCPL